MTIATEIAHSHHEWWDGRGYPQGLGGEDIPLSARIVAVADVYDALRSPRPYKRAWTHQEATEYIAKGAGTQFDPGLVEIFLDMASDFDLLSREIGEDIPQRTDGLGGGG